MQEVHTLLRVKDSLRASSTVMLDIDNTLLKPLTTYVGSDQWYAWQCRAIEKRSPFRMCESKAELGELLNELYCRVPFQAVDEHHAEFFQQIRRVGGKLILVSARPPDAREATLFQIKSALGWNEFDFDLLLCNGKSKGAVLKQYLRLVEPQDRPAPPRIFVDDSLYNVVDVKSRLDGQVTCFFYLGARADVERFHNTVLACELQQRQLVEESRSWLMKAPLFSACVGA